MISLFNYHPFFLDNKFMFLFAVLKIMNVATFVRSVVNLERFLSSFLSFVDKMCFMKI